MLVMTTLPAGQKNYAPAKVVYDVSSPKPEDLTHILDRVSMLQNVYDNNSFEASIILVIHEGAIPLFAKSSDKFQDELMVRANSLTMGDIIQLRVCRASAKLQGFKTGDFQAFIQVVPMADAEIVELQHQGYAYIKWTSKQFPLTKISKQMRHATEIRN